MTGYLARLKARSSQERLPDVPPKLTKPGFVGFDSGLGGHFLQANGGAESVALPTPAVAPTNTDTGSWTEAHEERSAVIEFDGRAPRAWGRALPS